MMLDGGKWPALHLTCISHYDKPQLHKL